MASARATTLDSAESAYRDGDFAQAGRLFRSYASEHRDKLMFELAQFRAAQCDIENGEYETALAALIPLADGGGAMAERSALWIGVSHYRCGDYEAARRVWGSLTENAVDGRMAGAALIGSAWSAIRLDDLELARKDLRTLGSAYPEASVRYDVPRWLDALDAVNRAPRKDPVTARRLSTFVPGLGQLYAGRRANGLASAALTGAFAWWIARSVANRQWVDAAFLYLVGARFYWGGRDNAARFAQEHNELRRRDALRNLYALEP